MLDSFSGVSRLYRSCAVTHLSESSVATDLANELGDSRPPIRVPNINDKSPDLKMFILSLILNYLNLP